MPVSRAFLLCTLIAQCCMAQDSYDSLLASARQRVNAGQWAEAVTVANQAAKLQPLRWEAYVVIGTAESAQRHTDAAIRAFSTARSAAPPERKAAVQAALDKEISARGTPAAPPGILSGDDEAKFAEAQSAITKFQDCKAAVSALSSVSEAGRQTTGFFILMANAQECSGNITAALENYRMYNTRNPGKPEIVAKIGELSYLTKKQSAAEQAAAEQKDSVEKAASERRITRPRAIEEAAATLQQALNLAIPHSRHGAVSDIFSVRGCTLINDTTYDAREALKGLKIVSGKTRVTVDLADGRRKFVFLSLEGSHFYFSKQNVDRYITAYFALTGTRETAWRSARALEDLCQNP